MRHDLGMERDADVMNAERLDRPVEQYLAALDREAALGDRRGDIARRDRPIELAGIARLADDDEALAVKLARNTLRL
jgi:hypothetical protein